MTGMERWVRPDEASVWLRVSVANVHVLAHRDQWHRRRLGRTVRYAFDDVDETRRQRMLRNRVARV